MSAGKNSRSLLAPLHYIQTKQTVTDKHEPAISHGPCPWMSCAIQTAAGQAAELYLRKRPAPVTKPVLVAMRLVKLFVAVIAAASLHASSALPTQDKESFAGSRGRHVLRHGHMPASSSQSVSPEGGVVRYPSPTGQHTHSLATPMTH